MARLPKSGKKTFRVSDVITDHGTALGKLLRRAGMLMQIEHLLTGFLEPELAGQFQVAALHGSRLVLITPSASRATQLRMRSPQLIRSLDRAGVPGIERIDVRVAPLVEQPERERKRRSLSPAARQAFDLMARIESGTEEADGQDGPVDHTDGGSYQKTD